MADFYLHVRLDQGGKRRVTLRNQIILPECPHHLISVGEEASRGKFEMKLEAKTGRAVFELPDDKTTRLLNMGVIVVPDKAIPMFPIQAHGTVELDGIHPDKVSYGGHKRAMDVSAESLHNRFNHRTPERLNRIFETSADAPALWVTRLKNQWHRTRAMHACGPRLRNCTRKQARRKSIDLEIS
jgi:hypothetical protein